MFIRPAQPTDLEPLSQLDARCNPNPWSAKQFQAALMAHHDTLLVAEQQSNIQGFIVWQTMFDEIELHLIATAPEMRRQGIARCLMANLFQAAQENKITRILLEVRESNQAAQALYQALGFAVCGRRKNYYAGVETAVLMEKLC